MRDARRLIRTETPCVYQRGAHFVVRWKAAGRCYKRIAQSMDEAIVLLAQCRAEREQLLRPSSREQQRQTILDDAEAGATRRLNRMIVRLGG